MALPNQFGAQFEGLEIEKVFHTVSTDQPTKMAMDSKTSPFTPGGHNLCYPQAVNNFILRSF
jgi:hypothetical protein